MSDHWKDLADKLGTPSLDPVPRKTSSRSSAHAETSRESASKSAPVTPAEPAPVAETPAKRSSWDSLARLFGYGESKQVEAPAPQPPAPTKPAETKPSDELEIDWQRPEPKSSRRDREPARSRESARPNEGSRSESTRSESPRSESPRGDSPRSESTRNESPRSDSRSPRGRGDRGEQGRGEQGRGEQGRGESPRQDSRRSEAARVERSADTPKGEHSIRGGGRGRRNSPSMWEAEVEGAPESVAEEPINETRNAPRSDRNPRREAPSGDAPRTREQPGRDRGSEESSGEGERRGRRRRPRRGQRQMESEVVGDSFPIDDPIEDSVEPIEEGIEIATVRDEEETPRRPRRRGRRGRDRTDGERPDKARPSEERISGEIDSIEPELDGEIDGEGDEAPTRHIKVPTWAEAIGVLVEVNAENHRRGADGGHPRRRNSPPNRNDGRDQDPRSSGGQRRGRR